MTAVWTTPRTWATNELVTAALLNQHLRDNMEFLRQFEGARVNNSANIGIPNNVTTTITYNTLSWGTVPLLHSTVTNPGRLTARITGWYLVGAQVRWAANNTGVRQLGITHNGGASLAISTISPTSSMTDQAVTTVCYLLANEYVYSQAYQNSGVTLNVESFSHASPTFWMVYLGI